VKLYAVSSSVVNRLVGAGGRIVDRGTLTVIVFAEGIEIDAAIGPLPPVSCTWKVKLA